MNRYIFFTNEIALRTDYRTIGLTSLPIVGNYEGNFKVLDSQSKNLVFTEKDIILLVNDDININNVAWIEHFIALIDTKAIYAVFHSTRFDMEKQYRPLQAICGNKIRTPLYHVIHHHSVPNHFYHTGLSEYLRAPTKEARFLVLQELADTFPKSIPAIELFKHLSVIRRKVVTGDQVDLAQELPLVDNATGNSYWNLLPMRADGKSWEAHFHSMVFESAFTEFEIFLVGHY